MCGKAVDATWNAASDILMLRFILAIGESVWALALKIESKVCVESAISAYVRL